MKSIPYVSGLARVTAVALVSAVIGAPAFAADHVKVRRSADPQVTYKRLQAAAAELCGPADQHSLARFRVWTMCYERTLDGAVVQMQEPALLAIHRQHGARGGMSAG